MSAPDKNRTPFTDLQNMQTPATQQPPTTNIAGPNKPTHTNSKIFPPRKGIEKPTKLPHPRSISRSRTSRTNLTSTTAPSTTTTTSVAKESDHEAIPPRIDAKAKPQVRKGVSGSGGGGGTQLSREDRRQTSVAASTQGGAGFSTVQQNNARGNGAHRPLGTDERRRTAASLTFTNNPPTGTRTGLAAKRGVQSQQQYQQQQAAIRNSKVNNQYLREMKESIAELKQSVVTNQSLPDLLNRYETLVGQMKRLEAVHDDDERRLKEALSKRDDDKRAVDAAREDATRAIKQVEELRVQLNDAQPDQGALADLKDKMSKLSSEVAQRCAERDAALEQVNRLEGTNAALRVQVAETEKRATESSALVSAQRDTIAQQQAEIHRLERQRDAVTIERDDLQVDLQSQNSKLRAATKEVQELSASRDALRSEAASSRREADNKLGETQREAEKIVKAAIAERDAAIAERDAAILEQDRRSRENDLLRVQVEASKEAHSAMEGRVTRLAADNIAKTARLETVCSERDELQEVNKRKDEEMQQKTAEMVELHSQAREDAKHRRKLHNMIQELKGNIRVFCRVRPQSDKEAASASAGPLFEYTDKGHGVVAHTPAREEGKTLASHAFKFDKVFDPSSSQATVFEEISELVQSALDGYRVCIFAYGQTGSGKTHTMLGRRGNGDAELGMIPRAVRQIFDSAKMMERDGWSFKLTASFVEIYNEMVRDLLGDGGMGTVGGKPGSGSKGNGDCRITFNAETKLCSVADVTTVNVSDEEQVQRLIERSIRNRATAATKVNERSSRSHSVFRLGIVGRNASTGQTLNGLLNLIDLAGSERLAQSKAEGERLRETKHINKSLSALGDVIAALANGDRHVPFRNSKLTYLLQDSLGGDCKTLMFVNVSHAVESMNESVCSLRFAAKVNSCHVGTAQRSARIEL